MWGWLGVSGGESDVEPRTTGSLFSSWWWGHAEGTDQVVQQGSPRAGKLGDQPTKAKVTRAEFAASMSYQDKAATASHMRSEKEARKAFMQQQKEMIRQRGAQLRKEQQGLGMTAVARKAAQAQDAVRVVDLSSLLSKDRVDIQKALHSDMTGIREAW